MTPKPTMQDVAELAGVSRSLVSLVFQGANNVSDARRQAVLDAAERLGYRPNRIARNLAQGRSMTIGAVIDDLQNPFFTLVLDAVERQIDASGYQLMVANGARSTERSIRAAETFAELQVDALVLLGIRGPEATVIDLARRCPTVSIARGIDTDDLDSVQVDEPLGSTLAVEHLAALGHERIVHIDGGLGASADDRRAGYRAAMRSAGLERHTEIIAGEFTHEAGIKAALELSQRSSMPTAVFAGNDLVAAGLWMQLERGGQSVPGDLSLIGFDDVSFPGFGGVGLTTVHQPIDRLGERAAELVLERLSGRRDHGVHELLAPTLVERSSTRSI